MGRLTNILGVQGLAAAAAALFAGGVTVCAANAPLADAVEKRDASAMAALLAKSSEVNAVQADGMTALHWAVYQDDLETAKKLLKAGANVKAETRYGIVPLSLACGNGSAEMVTLLLDAGADPNAALRGGETVLMTAARTGKPAAISVLLARGAKVDAKEKRGQTALMWAAADGHAQAVDILIKAGADFRTPLESGFTPLFFAVREGRGEVVRVLLKAGADVNEAIEPRKRAGKGPGRGMSPLLMAVENGHLELAVDLLKAGADPNDQRSGFTALHTITWVRKPNRGDGDDGDPAPIGSGPLNSMQFVKKLAEHGADVNARLKSGKSGKGVLSRTGMTPFMMAAMTDDVPLMKLLVSLGADPKITNVDGTTPLMAAAGIGTLAPGEEAGTEEEALEAVQYLIGLGADVNTVDKNGETAMHGAAYKSLPKMVEFLQARGAKIGTWHQKNRYGWTPLKIAEGYRPGNFKPNADTIAALQKVMIAAGVTPQMSGVPVMAEGDDAYKTPKKTLP